MITQSHYPVEPWAVRETALLTPETFASEIASCRTFLLEAEAAVLVFGDEK
jgi:hypothetical protein